MVDGGYFAVLVGHAGAAQSVAFVTAWLLLSLNRHLVRAAPLMGRALALARLRAALPAAVVLDALVYVLA
jgi:hypothetical protein